MLVLVPLAAQAQPRRSTVDRLADDLLAVAGPSLARLGREGHALAWSLRMRRPPVAGPRERLERVMDELLTARLAAIGGLRAPDKLPSPPDASRADLVEGARGAGADLLLVVDVFERKNHIHVVGELFDVAVDFWTRLRRPVTGMRTHFYATARIDAELRALLDADTSRRVKLELVPLAGRLVPAAPPLAASVGDLDGDGLNEVAFVSESAIEVVRLVDDGPAEVVATATLDGLPRRAERSRDAFASALVADVDGDGQSELTVWTSDLRYGHVFGLAGRLLSPVRREVPGSVCGERQARGVALVLCGPPLAVMPSADPKRPRPLLVLGSAPLGRNHFDGRTATCTVEREEALQPLDGLHFGLAGMSLKLPERGAAADLVGVVDAAGVLRVRGPDRTWVVTGAGTAMALVDLQDDGDAEAVTSGAGWPDEGDAVSVTTLARDGRVVAVWRKPTDAIVALAGGDVDNDGLNEVLVVTRGGIHLLELN